MSSRQDTSVDEEEEIEHLCCPHLLSALLCMVCPCGICSALKKVDPNEQAALIYWGTYTGTVKKPGLYFLNPYGLEMLKISTKRQTLHLNDVKVLDAKGNPIILSGVVTFWGTSAKSARIDVDKAWPFSDARSRCDTFLELQAAAVLKRIASRFPYEAPSGTPSLQTEGAAIAEELRQMLQEKANVTGAQVLSFDLVDLSYAPEIAQVMLVRQQAEALVDARRSIVEAAVDMTKSAVASLRESGESMDVTTCRTITSNLLTVICSQTAATPTVAMGCPGQPPARAPSPSPSRSSATEAARAV